MKNKNTLIFLISLVVMIIASGTCEAQPVVTKYFDHLAQNPERIDALLIWTVCVFFCWFWLIKYRERLIAGLEGDNKLWEGGEQFVWLFQMITPPVVFYFLCFVPDQRVYVLVILAVLIAFVVGGRWLLEYLLVLKTGGTVKDLNEIKEETKPQ